MELKGLSLVELRGLSQVELKGLSLVQLRGLSQVVFIGAGNKYIGTCSYLYFFFFLSTCLYFILALQKCTCRPLLVRVHYEVHGTLRQVHCKYIRYVQKKIIIYFFSFSVQ